MSRLPRKYVFEAHEVGIYHCINRCVRRAYLCGFDAVSQVSFEHRRRWLQDRLMFLAGVMGLDVLGFCVMSNHLHLVVRNRPDLVGQWSPEEVARRWYRLCPPLIPGTRELAEEPSDSDLALIVNDPNRLAQTRLPPFRFLADYLRNQLSNQPQPPKIQFRQAGGRVNRNEKRYYFRSQKEPPAGLQSATLVGSVAVDGEVGLFSRRVARVTRGAQR